MVTEQITVGELNFFILIFKDKKYFSKLKYMIPFQTEVLGHLFVLGAAFSSDLNGGCGQLLSSSASPLSFQFQKSNFHELDWGSVNKNMLDLIGSVAVLKVHYN